MLDSDSICRADKSAKAKTKRKSTTHVLGRPRSSKAWGPLAHDVLNLVPHVVSHDLLVDLQTGEDANRLQRRRKEAKGVNRKVQGGQGVAAM